MYWKYAGANRANTSISGRDSCFTMKRSSAPQLRERHHPEATAEVARPTEGLHEVDFGLPAGGVPLEAAGEAFDELSTAAALLAERFELLDPENRAARRDVAELDVCEASQRRGQVVLRTWLLNVPPSLKDLWEDPRRISSAVRAASSISAASIGLSRPIPPELRPARIRESPADSKAW